MNKLLERVNALEDLCRHKQHWIDQVVSGKVNQQGHINELEAMIDALEREANRKGQLTAVDGPTKSIKISANEIVSLFLLLHSYLFTIFFLVFNLLTLLMLGAHEVDLGQRGTVSLGILQTK